MLIFFLFSFLISLAASTDIDQLINDLDDLTGLEKISKLNEISIEYRIIDPDQSIDYARKSYDLARKLGKEDLKGEALHNIAAGYYLTSDLVNAKIYYSRAIRVYEKTENKSGLAKTYNNMALIYKKRSELDKALEYLFNSLKLEEELENNAGISYTLLNLGNFYYDLDEKEKALEYFKQALVIEEKLEDKANLANILNNIGIIYDETKNYHYAIDYYFKSLELEKINNNTNGIATTLNNIGIAYQNLDVPDKALEYLLQSLQLTEEIDDPYGYCNTTLNIGVLYLQILDLDKSKTFLESGLEIANNNEFTDLLILAYDSLHKNYEEREDYLNSLKYYKYYTAESGKIFNQANRDLITEIQQRYEGEKRLMEQNKSQVSRQITLRNLFMLVLVALLMIFLAISNSYHNKNLVNNELQKKNDQLLEMNLKLEEVARTDPLTMLSNRRDMLQKIDYETNRFNRSKKPFVIIISDIDYFKMVNDKYGHDGGDYVLVNLSRMFMKTMRKQDIIGRWGGEEFIFLLPETDILGGKKLAEKLRIMIEKHPFIYNNKQLQITMTFGVSVYSSSTKSVEQVINRADEHLYKGKRKGRNCVVTDRSSKVVIG